MRRSAWVDLTIAVAWTAMVWRTSGSGRYWIDRRYCSPGADRELVDARDAWGRLGNPRTLQVHPVPFRAVVFKNDGVGYIDWRDGHQDGFVLNVPYLNAGDERAYQLRHANIAA